ncbi:sulfurtransferase [Sinimarinibacterium sp. CAU 1509]|uniref:sulfurtransferase n=1 Tax=Sinimarinibacterium sp. CAU 1509 TaxID=2562283 RepID=UPI0010AD413F|nr:rhodanese-like domain-containing protein [Sinimarinibacterium sp. CAU 1509]TJY64835.1 sulfurtransferase [Sinimarinibacterium sp. CAU 1509]
MKVSVLASVSAMVLAMGSMAAVAGGVPGPVVSAEWLNKHAGDVVVIDVRDDAESFTQAPEYESGDAGAKKLVAAGGHIDGARLVEFGKLRVSREIDGKKIDKLLPDQAYVEDLMQSAGVPKGKALVITSPGETVSEVEEAARLYWTLKVYGADDMAILDGGNAAWLEAGYAVSTDKPSAARGDWKASAARKAYLAETADVEKATKGGVQLVDARPLDQYLGLKFKKPAVTAGGHVAGAKSLPGEVRTRSVGISQKFLSEKEYRGVLAAQGISTDAPAITYCNTGHMAAGAWFVESEIMGGKNVSLYDGSMHEWTTLGHPVVGVTD